MLKLTLNIRDGIGVTKFLKLVPFLKKVSYQAKKSKVILIMGISGAMRRDELTKMSIDDIQDEHSVLIVAVPDTKTGIKRTFTVTNPDFVRLYRKYAALVPCTHPELKIVY
ncbi:unnamed protein product [Tenebrio molitor]|nr:unnamed protein product [Tenebrio molitor]